MKYGTNTDRHSCATNVPPPWLMHTHQQQKTISPAHSVSFCHRKHFQTHGLLWHMVWQPWNREWGAESHHYGPAIIMSQAWCLSMCHLTLQLPHPSVARGAQARALHHFLGFLMSSTLSEARPLYGCGVQLYAMDGQATVAFFIPTSGSASCSSQRWWINQQNHLAQSLEGNAADSWPFKALVCQPLHMMSNILCNHSETTQP